MNKRIFLWFLPVLFIGIIVLFSIEESRTFIVAVVLRIFFFLKHNILALLAAFFLVKGKFILTLFLKKIAILSATGLSKRYLIEKVINKNIKIHFLDHIADDIKRLLVYIKGNFKDFPIIKQIIATLAFLGSLGFVGKFMGGMLAMKVFVAKFWSFILGLVLKSSTAIVYFFTDYLWGLWIAPIIEVFIFSWVLSWMERVPFLKKYLTKIYRFFLTLFEWFEEWIEKIFHIPLKRLFRFMTKRIRKYIYTFIGYTKVSARERLQEVRVLTPNSHTRLMKKRKERKELMKDKVHTSIHKRLVEKREARK